MSIAYLKDLKLTMNPGGSVTVRQKGENWGGARGAAPDSLITISDINGFINCIEEMKKEKSEEW